MENRSFHICARPHSTLGASLPKPTSKPNGFASKRSNLFMVTKAADPGTEFASVADSLRKASPGLAGIPLRVNGPPARSSLWQQRRRTARALFAYDDTRLVTV